MKKILIIILLLSFFSLESCKDKAKEEKIKKIQVENARLESRGNNLMRMLSQSNAYLQWNFTLPSNVAFFTDLLGKPDSVFFDSDKYCPIGNVLTWIIEEENIIVTIVADCYNPSFKPNDEVRLIAFKSMRSKKPNDLIALNGIRLESSETDFLSRIKRYTVTATDFKLSSYNEPTIFDKKYISGKFTYHQLENGAYYYHFAFDESGILKYIYLSSFNVKESC